MTAGVQGPQVVARVGSVLRALGGFEPRGASTTEIARRTGLARPTAHRLLSSLLTEGLVDRDTASGLWSLGPELFLLGSAAATRYDISHHARDIVEGIARTTGESAFLSARRGDETVCLISVEGSFPLRSHVLYEGIRFPLGVASAGLVILAHLPDREIDGYFGRASLEDVWGPEHSEPAVRERIASTRHTGFALNPGLIVEGSWGMGAAVFDSAGAPAWALSVTGVETRFRPERHTELGSLLIERAHALSIRVQRQGR